MGHPKRRRWQYFNVKLLLLCPHPIFIASRLVCSSSTYQLCVSLSVHNINHLVQQQQQQHWKSVGGQLSTQPSRSVQNIDCSRCTIKQIRMTHLESCPNVRRLWICSPVHITMLRLEKWKTNGWAVCQMRRTTIKDIAYLDDGANISGIPAPTWIDLFVIVIRWQICICECMSVIIMITISVSVIT